MNKSLPFISFIIIASLMICKAFTGHTAAVPNQALAVLMDFLHLLSMALWLGGLMALLVILPGLADRQAVQEDKKTFYWSIIQRFSKWAFLFVIILIISGIYSSLQHVPTIHSMFNTIYGQLLLAKNRSHVNHDRFRRLSFSQREKANEKNLVIVWEWSLV
ncbi:CopD family protein [Peribacillus frigoritolerans]|nr:CopD family protein [Peribacillus frigoritolerans]